MASVVSICNMALNLIGQGTITSLTENTKSARVCNAFYDSIRDSVLRDNDWNFANITEELSLMSGETIPGWDYIYIYPVKCLALRKIVSKSDTDNELPHSFESALASVSKQRCIATNVNQAFAKYTYQVTDPNLFDPTFIEALAHRLASSLAKPLAGDAQLATGFSNSYKQIIESAKLSNAIESKPRKNTYSAIIGSR